MATNAHLGSLEDRLARADVMADRILSKLERSATLAEDQAQKLVRAVQVLDKALRGLQGLESLSVSVERLTDVLGRLDAALVETAAQEYDRAKALVGELDEAASRMQGFKSAGNQAYTVAELLRGAEARVPELREQVDAVTGFSANLAALVQELASVMESAGLPAIRDAKAQEFMAMGANGGE